MSTCAQGKVKEDTHQKECESLGAGKQVREGLSIAVLAVDHQIQEAARLNGSCLLPALSSICMY